MSLLPPATRAVPALLAAAVLGVLSTGAGFREDEVECDHAASVLVECCPELERDALDCSFGVGCGGESFDPWLSITESECIRARECSEIQQAGICERVAERVRELDRSRNTTGEAGGDAGTDPSGFDVAELPSVCP